MTDLPFSLLEQIDAAFSLEKPSLLLSRVPSSLLLPLVGRAIATQRRICCKSSPLASRIRLLLSCRGLALACNLQSDQSCHILALEALIGSSSGRSKSMVASGTPFGHHYVVFLFIVGRNEEK